MNYLQAERHSISYNSATFSEKIYITGQIKKEFNNGKSEGQITLKRRKGGSHLPEKTRQKEERRGERRPGLSKEKTENRINN